MFVSKLHICHVCISQKVKGVLLSNLQHHYFVIKTKILADVQICISVPLIKKLHFFCALQWNLMQNILLQITGVINLALPSTASEA